MRRSLSQIQVSGGACGSGAGADVDGTSPAAATLGSVLRRRTLPRFFSIVAWGGRGVRGGRSHGGAAAEPAAPRLVFFSIVACRHTQLRRRAPAQARPAHSPTDSTLHRPTNTSGQLFIPLSRLDRDLVLLEHHLEPFTLGDLTCFFLFNMR